jgi:hypothetical protein
VLRQFFKEILYATFISQEGDSFSLFQIGHFCYVEETHVSLERKPSVLEEGATSTLFPCEFLLVFERNISYKL